MPADMGWTRLLAPLMRCWVASAQRSSKAPFRPMDVPQAHAPGCDSDRILIFGAGPAMGWGVTTHDLALPGAVARALSARTGRGADVDLIAQPDMLLSHAISELPRLNLSRYDAVIIVLGVNDAVTLTPPARWCQEAALFYNALRRSSPADTKIIVAGIPPIRSISIFDSPLGSVADRHANALNRETARLCSDSPVVTFVPLGAPTRIVEDDVRHRSPETYADWASDLADSLEPLLASQNHANDSRRNTESRQSVSEAARQDAVDRFELQGDGSHARIMRILSTARDAFHVDVAAMTVVDGDRQSYLAQVGADLEPTPRRDSFCDVAIRGSGALVIGDASTDDRFRDNPMVSAGPGIRFYAGFPVELPSGERIGTLCVVDKTPRPVDDFDDVLLRELALMVQKELWT